jgi:hypothetical protein
MVDRDQDRSDEDGKPSARRTTERRSATDMKEGRTAGLDPPASERNALIGSFADFFISGHRQGWSFAFSSLD